MVISSVTAARHKAAVVHKTRRTFTRYRLPALAAAVLTTAVVGVSVAAPGAVSEVPDERLVAGALARQADPLVMAERFEDREQRVSRAARRVTIEDVPEPVGHRFATAPLKLRLAPRESARSAGVVEERSKLFVTGERRNGYAEVVMDRKTFWVSAEYLARTKPAPVETVGEAGGTSAVPVAGECTAAPPSGVVAGVMAVYEAVCARFPMITTYGGWRADGEHSDGRAVDIMVSGDLGWQVANYLLANAGSFGLYDIIHSQRIWTAERSSEGWRPMEDRGSVTANHYDHVHVKVY